MRRRTIHVVGISHPTNKCGLERDGSRFGAYGSHGKDLPMACRLKRAWRWLAKETKGSPASNNRGGDGCMVLRGKILGANVGPSYR